MNIIYLFLLFFISAGNILFAGNNNITPLDAAVETALHKIKEISSDIEIINKSLSTYIPFSCEERSILPFLGYECWVEEHPCLKAEFPDKYDILFLKADEERKKYNILFLNDNKIYFYYICLLENKMMKQYSIMVSDSEDVVSSALMKIMKQYKLSNMINQQVSLENLEFIINLFGVYGNEVSGTPLVAYGYNSKIFGVVFGGLLLPREDSTAFKIYSLFNSMMAYFENLKNNDIPRCDSLFINGLNSNIEKIILNSSLFGTAKTLDGCPGSR
ncbi:hypothetical protein CXU01_03545 [Akkermansia muciniphila]|uniref:hypothetical protein n=1 Tax=Akkermansia muciniphila TaxID=239935 RepID=UPI000C9AE88A|nr:hypothetical protein [Akkermansia muciniphila]PNC82415.1 hypothetical protein CXU01_03545 [Akkermansia muciniphila]